MCAYCCCLGIEHNSAEYLHLLIEALQLSFADTTWYCADPGTATVPVEGMLSKEYAAKRSRLLKGDRYSSTVHMIRSFENFHNDIIYCIPTDVFHQLREGLRLLQVILCTSV